MRAAALLVGVFAAGLAILGGAAVAWPTLMARIDRLERAYADRLKDLFRPVSSARSIAIAQHAGPVAAALVIFALTGNPVFAIAGPAVGFVIPNVIFNRLKAKRLERINRQLPDALRVMADAAKAGLALPHMIRMVATQAPRPIAEEFGLMVHAMDLGDGVDEALTRARTRLALPNFDLMAIAMAVNRERGGDIGELFGRLAESIRRLSEVEEKIDTETASVRLSAKIMVATIPVFGLALFLIDPAAVGMLFSTPLGAAVLVVVAILATTGYQMIQRLAHPEI